MSTSSRLRSPLSSDAALEPLANPVEEGKRIAEAAAERGIPLRLLGGVAVALTCPRSAQPPLRRNYGDIDLATRGRAKMDVVGLLEAYGYVPDREFNTLNGNRRLYFFDQRNQRQLDVFVDEANLCHRINFRRRLELVPLTLPLADLVILKLQVLETNDKDYLDLCAIFADHDLSEDESGVNRAYIAEMAGADWGLWRTLGMVAERATLFAEQLDGFEAAGRVVDRLDRLASDLNSVPKTRAWKLRAKLGDRKRWYDTPEEAI